MINAVHKERKSNNVREENKFLDENQLSELVAVVAFMDLPVGHLYKSDRLVLGTESLPSTHLWTIESRAQNHVHATPGSP